MIRIFKQFHEIRSLHDFADTFQDHTGQLDLPGKFVKIMISEFTGKNRQFIRALKLVPGKLKVAPGNGNKKNSFQS